MEPIPAIDIRGGRCVRLLRGDYAKESDYGDPLEHALELVAGGATRLHVVDLDAARSGESENRPIIFEIAARATVPIEVGGGIRDEKTAMALLGGGVDRVVLGTAAIENERFARLLALAHPGKVVLGLDHRRVGGRRVVAVRGWEENSALSLEDALARFVDVDFAALITTDITVDGTLEGPDLEGLEIALARAPFPVIASGGIGSVEHLRALTSVHVHGRSLAGVVIGRALYSGAITLKEAIDACAA